jgi:hypothetical protein
MQSSQEKLGTVRSYWKDFLACSDVHLDTSKVWALPHAEKVLDQIDDDEIYILEWKNGGTIVSVSSRLVEKVSVILWWGESSQIEQKLRASMNILKKHGPIITQYCLDDLGLFDTSLHVRKLTRTDISAYEAFMSTCDAKDSNMVDMDFANPFHVFFGFFEEGKILSLGNYQRDSNIDKIAHIGILTSAQAKWKGYATFVVQSLMNDITMNEYIPQWRVHLDNVASQKMAVDFKFSEILRSYSLISS